MSSAPGTTAEPSHADAAALARIMRRSFAEGWSEDAFRKELARPATRARVAVASSEECGESEECVGYVLGWRVLDEVEILSFAVDPAWRRSGVATWLLEDYLDSMQREKVRRVMLEVRESNTAARALYRSGGFEVEGSRREYYRDGETALLLGTSLRTAR